MKTQTLATLVGLGTLAIGSVASAGELITFVAEGNIMRLDDPANLTGGKATTWSWTYSFDAGARDQLPGDPGIGLYALGDWELTIGTLTVSFTGDVITVFDGVPGLLGNFDVYRVQSAIEPPPPGWFVFDARFDLRTADLSTFSSDALPLTPPNPADFETRIFTLAGLTSGSLGLFVEGDVRSIVPAPSALALLGLAGLTGMRRRRRQ